MFTNGRFFECVSQLSGTLAVFILANALLPAQTFQASVTGVVRDQSNAVIPNAQVVAVEIASGTKHTAVTNGDGLYRFPALPRPSTTSPPR